LAVAGCAAFALCSVGYTLWFWVGPPAWRARLNSPAPVFDFGERGVGETVECEFVLRNTGLKGVEIHRVLSGCGCLTADAPQDRLAPGDSLTLPVRVSLKGLRGRVRKTVVVKSNDPERPSLVLVVTGTVRSSFRTDPEKVVFGDVAAGQSPVVPVRITCDTGRTVLRVRSTSPAVEAVLRPGSPGAPSVIEARVVPGAPPGAFAGELEVGTSDEAEPWFEIPVTGRVVGR